jgi:ArsR family transcriptional regulator, arsenate/arsenite/antimonite-responsive transcriptional repressor
MQRSTATSIFESLSSGLRLEIYRLLVRRGPDGLVAGEIGAILDVPASNLSFHLKALTHAGMVTVTQEGRFQHRRILRTLPVDRLWVALCIAPASRWAACCPGLFQRWPHWSTARSTSSSRADLVHGLSDDGGGGLLQPAARPRAAQGADHHAGGELADQALHDGGARACCSSKYLSSI